VRRDTPERRRDVRIKTAFEVVDAIPAIEGIATLSDISAGGACLQGTSARPAVGRTVQLTIPMSDRRPPLLLVGTVVRHAETGFAVTFDKPSPQLAELMWDEPPPEWVLETAQSAGPARGMVKRVGISAYREIPVECCTHIQWISGRICTLPTRSLLDHLNMGDPFLRMVDVVTPQYPEPMAFMALRTDAVDLILPAEGQNAIDTEQRGAKITERSIRCLLPYGVLEGTIGVLDKIRVSDHLMRCGTFMLIRACQFRLAKGLRAPRDLARVGFALVNVRRVIGISDLAAAPPPPDEPPLPETDTSQIRHRPGTSDRPNFSPRSMRRWTGRCTRSVYAHPLLSGQTRDH
jgi:hypothetical protein